MHNANFKLRNRISDPGNFDSKKDFSLIGRIMIIIKPLKNIMLLQQSTVCKYGTGKLDW
jgi:hypothetical protein